MKPAQPVTSARLGTRRLRRATIASTRSAQPGTCRWNGCAARARIAADRCQPSASGRRAVAVEQAVEDLADRGEVAVAAAHHVGGVGGEVERRRGQAHLVEVDDRDVVADEQLVDVEVAVRRHERQARRQLAAEPREQRVDARAQRRAAARRSAPPCGPAAPRWRSGGAGASARRSRRALELGGERAGRRRPPRAADPGRLPRDRALRGQPQLRQRAGERAGPQRPAVAARSPVSAASNWRGAP